MYTSYLSPTTTFSSPNNRAPYHLLSHLHRRRNSPIPVPIYSASDVIDENTNTNRSNGPTVYSGYYRIPITDSSSNKESNVIKPILSDVSVVHEKPSTRKPNLKFRSPSNPFEEAEGRRTDLDFVIDSEWERELAKRKELELEQEQLDKALRESIETEKERQRIEQEMREQEELELALKLSEEEARKMEIQRSFRLKNEQSVKKGKAKTSESEQTNCDEELQIVPYNNEPYILTQFNPTAKSKIRLSPEPSLPYPNTTLITINMWGKQRFARRFFVDETIGSIRNWVETFCTPQNYTMRIISPTYLSNIKFSDVDMSKPIQDFGIYPSGEIIIEPC